VKVDGSFCRVALQISSNPNNEAPLTDLTIIMGVPEEVRGETLVTQPAGGVWNEGKRSVIWVVSELGDGEKFQLQARFEMENGMSFGSESEKPKFPVLVRCQCLFAQLSDIELEVRDIPDIFPAEVTMKIARRFRLSHRERS
jgi:Muniscin C-terminal mu homology domain